MIVEDDKLVDTHFHHLIDYLDKDDLLVFNNTKVLKARFFGSKKTGGKIEILIERILDNQTALAKIRASKSPKDNSTVLIDDELEVTVKGREGEFYILRFPSDIFPVLDNHGHLPLPPYIDRAAMLMTRNDTRPFSPGSRAPWRHRRPGFISTRNFLRNSSKKGYA